VKNSRKYYDDASQVLADLMLAAVRPAHSKNPAMSKVRLTEERLAMVAKSQADQPTPSSPLNLTRQSSTVEDIDRMSDGAESTVTNSKPNVPDEELRCVIAVVRHGTSCVRKITLLQYLLLPIRMCVWRMCVLNL
jgi:hypothetical protein